MAASKATVVFCIAAYLLAVSAEGAEESSSSGKSCGICTLTQSKKEGLVTINGGICYNGVYLGPGQSATPMTFTVYGHEFLKITRVLIDGSTETNYVNPLITGHDSQCSPVDEIITTPSPVGEITTTPSPVVEITTTPSPVVEITTTPSPVDEITTTPSPVVEITTTPSPVKPISSGLLVKVREEVVCYNGNYLGSGHSATASPLIVRYGFGIIHFIKVVMVLHNGITSTKTLHSGALGSDRRCEKDEFIPLTTAEQNVTAVIDGVACYNGMNLMRDTNKISPALKIESLGADYIDGVECEKVQWYLENGTTSVKCVDPRTVGHDRECSIQDNCTTTEITPTEGKKPTGVGLVLINGVVCYNNHYMGEGYSATATAIKTTIGIERMKVEITLVDGTRIVTSANLNEEGNHPKCLSNNGTTPLPTDPTKPNEALTLVEGIACYNGINLMHGVELLAEKIIDHGNEYYDGEECRKVEWKLTDGTTTVRYIHPLASGSDSECQEETTVTVTPTTGTKDPLAVLINGGVCFNGIYLGPAKDVTTESITLHGKECVKIQKMFVNGTTETVYLDAKDEGHDIKCDTAVTPTPDLVPTNPTEIADCPTPVLSVRSGVVCYNGIFLGNGDEASMSVCNTDGENKIKVVFSSDGSESQTKYMNPEEKGNDLECQSQGQKPTTEPEVNPKDVKLYEMEGNVCYNGQYVSKGVPISSRMGTVYGANLVKITYRKDDGETGTKYVDPTIVGNHINCRPLKEKSKYRGIYQIGRSICYNGAYLDDGLTFYTKLENQEENRHIEVTIVKEDGNTTTKTIETTKEGLDDRCNKEQPAPEPRSAAYLPSPASSYYAP